MYFLTLETTGAVGSVALAETGASADTGADAGEPLRIIGYKACSKPMSHLSMLIPMVRDLLREAGIGKEELGFVAVSAGPGSFTGIRIGVATARALCQGLNGDSGQRDDSEGGLDVMHAPAEPAAAPAEPAAAPAQPAAAPAQPAAAPAQPTADGCRKEITAVAVNTLDSFLYLDCVFRARERAEAIGQLPPTVCAIINARRGQVYGMVEGYLEAGPYMLTDVLRVLKDEPLKAGRKVLMLGDGTEAYRVEIDAFTELEKCRQAVCFAPEGEGMQDAKGAAGLAARLYAEGKQVSLEELLPIYMRKAEAEQKLASGELPICKGPAQE